MSKKELKMYEVYLVGKVNGYENVMAKSLEEAEEKAEEAFVDRMGSFDEINVDSANEMPRIKYKVKAQYADNSNKTILIEDYSYNVGLEYFTEVAKGFNRGVDILKLDWSQGGN